MAVSDHCSSADVNSCRTSKQQSSCRFSVWSQVHLDTTSPAHSTQLTAHSTQNTGSSGHSCPQLQLPRHPAHSSQFPAGAPCLAETNYCQQWLTDYYSCSAFLLQHMDRVIVISLSHILSLFFSVSVALVILAFSLISFNCLAPPSPALSLSSVTAS